MRGLIHSQVNASVLGGLLVDFGDKTSELHMHMLWDWTDRIQVDLSASSKVNRFNAALTREYTLCR